MKNLFNLFTRRKQDVVFAEFQEDDYLASPFQGLDAVDNQLDRIEMKIDKLIGMSEND
jgi:hypothetical protein